MVIIIVAVSLLIMAVGFGAVVWMRRNKNKGAVDAPPVTPSKPQEPQISVTPEPEIPSPETPELSPAAIEEPIAVIEEPAAVVEEPIAVIEESAAVVEEPIAVIEEPIAVKPTSAPRIPEDATLRRHFLTHVLSMLKALAPACPTDSALKRHHTQWLQSQFQQCLSDQARLDKLIADYEAAKRAA